MLTEDTITATSPVSTFDTAVDMNQPSTIADATTQSGKTTSSSSVTEVYCDPSSLSTGLSYNMTSVSSSTLSSAPFLPGEMVMAQGHLVHIVDSSTHPVTNDIQYAVRTTTGDVFITSIDTITPVPTLSPAPKSDITISTPSSSRASEYTNVRNIYYIIYFQPKLRIGSVNCGS